MVVQCVYGHVERCLDACKWFCIETYNWQKDFLNIMFAL